MKKTQLKKLIKSIQADAQLSGHNYDPDNPGKFCVVGGMVKSMGLEPEKVFGDTYQETDVNSLPDSLLEKLVKYYGLEQEELKHLQVINDECVTTPVRRRRLIAAAKELYSNQILKRQITELEERLELLKGQLMELQS